MEVEPLRRGKLRGSGGSASSAKSTWGSISRVFARSKHRNKITSPNSQEGKVIYIKLILKRFKLQIHQNRCCFNNILILKFKDIKLGSLKKLCSFHYLNHIT